MRLIDKKRTKTAVRFIARPDSAKELVVYKWPDSHISILSVVTVQPDEAALLVDRGRVVGHLDTGQHRLDGPGMSLARKEIEEFTGDRVLIGELYFVSLREFTNRAFEGSMGEFTDPDTDVMAETKVMGEYVMVATDPGKLIRHLLDTRAPLDNNSIEEVVSEQLLLTLCAHASKRVAEGGWDAAKLTSGEYKLQIEEEVLPVVNAMLADYGLSVTRVEDLSVSTAL